MTDEERAMLADTQLLSLKPVIYAANLSEDDFRNNIDTNENYKTVSEIAKAAGFCTPSHLANTFRAITKMTPREYRNAISRSPSAIIVKH